MDERLQYLPRQVLSLLELPTCLQRQFPAGSWIRKCTMARKSLAVGSEMPRLVPGFGWQIPIASR